MNIQINKLKEKIKTFLGKTLKSKKDININPNATKDDAEYKKRTTDMKVY